MQLKEVKNIFHKELDAIYPKEEVDSFFYLLIEHHLGLERFVLALRPNLTISKEEEQPLFEALSQLRLQRPIQYIMGKARFMDMHFMVDENVLIPRPETEELVRWIIDEAHTKPGLKILDVGTGSGCIAIALGKAFPRAEISALDISENALRLAQKNASNNDVAVEFLQKNILEAFILDTKFDIIVSNPPYIREKEKNEMQKNVLDYEPGSALFVPNEDPLLFYEAIAGFAKKNLNKNGTLFLEINQYLAKESQALLEHHNFLEIELRKDMFGNARMVKCQT